MFREILPRGVLRFVWRARRWTSREPWGRYRRRDRKFHGLSLHPLKGHSAVLTRAFVDGALVASAVLGVLRVNGIGVDARHAVAAVMTGLLAAAIRGWFEHRRLPIAR